jgi:hypothetical protein
MSAEEVTLPLRLENKEDVERVRERLRRRDPEALVGFLMSLAGESGPIGEQIRTFIVGDDVAQTLASIQRRIRGLGGIPSEYDYRHSYGQDIGTTLELIVDSVERLVLPRDPQAAFDALVALFEADAVAMENCREHHWEVECAYRRAAAAMTAAAKQLPPGEVDDRITTLLAADTYGVRACLASAFRQTLQAETGTPLRSST